MTIVTIPDPQADVTVPESTATGSAGCNFRGSKHPGYAEGEKTSRNGRQLLRNG